MTSHECDASSVDLGAVISHEIPDGMHRPVVYASWTMSKSERNYAQIGVWCQEIPQLLVCLSLHTCDRPQATPRHSWTKEGSSNTSCCKDATLGTDIGSVPISTAIQVYWRKQEHRSRLPLKEEDFTASEEPIFSLPVTSQQIAEATRKYPITSKVLSHTLNGWPALTVIETCSPTSTGTLSWALKRSHTLGFMCPGTSCFLWQAAWGATQKPLPSQNESPCSQLCLVAQHRQTLKGRWRLATTVQHSADSTSSAMVMAYMTLAESAYWLCRVSREIFLRGCWCPL